VDIANGLGKSAMESGVATDAKLVGFTTYDGNNAISSRTDTNPDGSTHQVEALHEMTQLTTDDGKNFLVDAQTGRVSPAYQLDANGQIPDKIQNGWVTETMRMGYGFPNAQSSKADSFGDPNDASYLGSQNANASSSFGLDVDRERRGWPTDQDPWNEKPDNSQPPAVQETGTDTGKQAAPSSDWNGNNQIGDSKQTGTDGEKADTPKEDQPAPQEDQQQASEQQDQPDYYNDSPGGSLYTE
jgi:hypothetical protein